MRLPIPRKIASEGGMFGATLEKEDIWNTL
jgi:hypothetical protein